MIENRRRVKAVVADTVIDHTDIRRKIVAAGTAFGTVKEQGFSYGGIFIGMPAVDGARIEVYNTVETLGKNN